MSIKLQRIIKAVAFILIFCVLFSGATYILRNKNEANIVLPFYDEPKNTLDVIFIGSSHVMCSVYPMELYDRYGIASYLQALRSFFRNPTISLKKRCVFKVRK